jgi:hypothetical protein
LPGELERIVMKALAKNRDERYQTAKDMAIDLKSLKRQLEMKVEFAQTSLMEAATPAREDAVQVADPVTDEKKAPVKNLGISPAQIAIVSLLLVIAGLIGWFIFRPQPIAPPSAPASTSTTPPGVPAAPVRQISYSLLIQKMKVGGDGKLVLGENQKPQEDGEPFAGLEQDMFDSNDRFSFNFFSPQDGYLYLLNEETLEDGRQLYTLQFPLSKESSAKVSGNQALATGRYSFEASKPIENLLLIWAERPVDELEAVKKLIKPKAFDAIRDPKKLAAVKKFLERYKQSTNDPVIDEAAKRTTIQGSGEVLIHLIKLTHQ